jgi:hypothetical protein
LYADFLEDPEMWTLLGIGTALAYAAGTARARQTASSAKDRSSIAATAPGTVA